VAILSKSVWTWFDREDAVETGLKGKVVIVTGAARGLGRAAVQAFAEEGSIVCILDVNLGSALTAAEELSAITEAVGFGLDVRDEAQVEKIVASIHERWGRIDVLVHCAGIARGDTQKDSSGAWLPMEDVTLADWEKVIGVNLTGTFLMDRAVAKRMIPAHTGRIINVASMSAMVANRGLPGLGPYSASKGGVVSLTKVLAAEWAGHGITVNTISPGYMATEMGVRSHSIPGFKELQLSLIPQGRLGKPEEFAFVALMLAADNAAYITGHEVVMDGGYTLW
jgi:NAD(P)-dependent dehydrogenase (short-subunit alcohol dehydrogenase family)